MVEKKTLKEEKNILEDEKKIISVFEEIVIKYITLKDESELDKINKYRLYFKKIILIIEEQKMRIKKFEKDFEKQKLILFNLLHLTEKISHHTDPKIFDEIKENCEKFKKGCELLENLIQEELTR